MTKAELVQELAKKLDITQADAQKNIDGLIDVIQDAVAAGNIVKIPGFLTIEPVATAARKARNPKTGVDVQVAAGRKVKVSVGSTFKSKVQI